MLTYTILSEDQEDVYEGFCEYTREAIPDEATCLVIVWNEDNPDLWWFNNNNPNSLTELRRYYSEQQAWVKPNFQFFKQV